MTSTMSAISLLGAVTLTLPASALEGRDPDLPPLTTRYRIEQTLTQEVDASAAGAGKQVIRFTTTSFVTVSLTDSAGGKAMRVVLDSMRGDSATPIPTAVMDSARGGEFRGFVEKNGRPGRLVPSAGNPAAAQVQGLLSDFFPWVRPGFTIGEAWADTSVATTGDGTDSVTVRRVTSYRASGKEGQGARRAVRIATTHASQVNGTQPTPQGSAKIEGSGTGTGSYLVSADGRYLGGQWDLKSALQLSGAFAPQPVPITISQSTKVATIP
jgi:hypothetical protein